ncbi:MULTISPECIES: Fpg/Nei family DNA glycosylase [unclassified Streptomyces]|uniref:Fpg/Nei family DNA glycosylase n=1 Tax=unclassified Streptomyces TaxID=2593676 RepID=UPI0022B6F037|nr:MULTISPECIES: DNA-formamidopyrimidine glycosylase family protein [unclassified Streptomyces]MCZ7414222.1 Fpg/Nei family DNA glycosylase [Streptomyces sp. WMMC897]MCZ7431240.1 Fpg/Nei family DNA glycosylase [Streptomyces sp. WMMC1477]
MPEGHTIHRLAADYRDRFAGRAVRASSPQGTFARSAALLDGHPLRSADATGKHLFLGFGPGLGWVHVHLGLFGKVFFGFPGDPAGTAPPPTVRLRLADEAAYADLRGPTRCELITDAEKAAVVARLGPDPLRADADPERAWARITRSRTAIATLLLDQKIVAGVGNVYRAEVLFRHGVHPYLPGRELTPALWRRLWDDLVGLMPEGVRTNRIDTVRPEHTPEAMGRPPRVDDHGGEVYVYRRAALPCHVCAAPVRTAELAGRNLFWCPGCQKP